MDHDEDEFRMAQICFNGRELRRRSRSRTREPDVLDCTSATMNRTTDFIDPPNEEELCLLGVRDGPHIIRTAAERRNLISQTVADVAHCVDMPIVMEEIEEDLHCFDDLHEGRPILNRRFRFNFQRDAKVSNAILSSICQRASSLSKLQRAKMDRRDFKILKSSLAMTEEYLKMTQHENSRGDSTRHDMKKFPHPRTISQRSNAIENHRRDRVLESIRSKLAPKLGSLNSGMHSSNAPIANQTSKAAVHSYSTVSKKSVESDEKPTDLRKILASIDNATNPKDFIQEGKTASQCVSTATMPQTEEGFLFGLATIKREVNAHAIIGTSIGIGSSSADDSTRALVADDIVNSSMMSSEDEDDDFWGVIDKKFNKVMESTKTLPPVTNECEYDKAATTDNTVQRSDVNPLVVSSSPSISSHDPREWKTRNRVNEGSSHTQAKTRKLEGKKQTVVTAERKSKQTKPTPNDSQVVARRLGRPPKDKNAAAVIAVSKTASVAKSTPRQNASNAKPRKSAAPDCNLGKPKRGRPPKSKPAEQVLTGDCRIAAPRIPNLRSCKSGNFSQFFA